MPNQVSHNGQEWLQFSDHHKGTNGIPLDSLLHILFTKCHPMCLLSFPFSHDLLTQRAGIIYLIPIGAVNRGASLPFGVFKIHSNIAMKITLRKAYKIKGSLHSLVLEEEGKHTTHKLYGRITKGVSSPKQVGAKRETEDSLGMASIADQTRVHKQQA